MSFEQHHSPKPGFRSVEFMLHAPQTGPILVMGEIPDDVTFSVEAKRLSRKATRVVGYSKPEWNDDLHMLLKKREVSADLGPAAITLREVHDATKEPAESLMRIQAFVINEATEGNEKTYPTEIFDYDATTHELHVFQLDDLREGQLEDQRDLQHIIDMESGFNPKEVGDREWAVLYGYLKYFAGEQQQ